MRLEIQGNARYELRYSARYQIVQLEQMVAPKAPPLNALESTSSGHEEPALVVAGRRRVPPTGVKTGVAGEGGATPVDRGRSPLPCDPPSAAGAARS